MGRLKLSSKSEPTRVICHVFAPAPVQCEHRQGLKMDIGAMPRALRLAMMRLATLLEIPLMRS